MQLIISSTIWSCRDNPISYTIIVALAFICYGGHFSSFPPAAVRIFGIENGGQIFTIMMFVAPIAALASFGMI